MTDFTQPTHDVILSSLELGSSITALISKLAKTTNVNERKRLTSSITVAVRMASRHSDQEVPVGFVLTSICKQHMIESQDTLYIFYFQEKGSTKS